jgi:hypothetical protein
MPEACAMKGVNLQSPEKKTNIVSEQVEVRGHIIDSLILPKILDSILNNGGTFRIDRITIGQARHDPSYALVEVRAESRATLEGILAQIADHGAVPAATQDCLLAPADIKGAFPEGFYSTTNQRTEVRLAGEWVPVLDQEMDCGIVVEDRVARCVPMNEVLHGDDVVVGHAEVRVFPEERSRGPLAFAFMDSNVSTEKPSGLRGHQPLDGHQTIRPGLVPDLGSGDRRGAVLAGAGGGTCGPGNAAGWEIAMTRAAQILMCPPDHYGIEYEINPWMSCNRPSDQRLAGRQWQDLYGLLEQLGVTISCLPPVAGSGVYGQCGDGLWRDGDPCPLSLSAAARRRAALRAMAVRTWFSGAAAPEPGVFRGSGRCSVLRRYIVRRLPDS